LTKVFRYFTLLERCGDTSGQEQKRENAERFPFFVTNLAKNIHQTPNIFLKCYISKEIKMKLNKVDHICIAVKNLAEARKIWEPVLGKTEPDDAYIDEPEKINVARYMIGEVAT